MKALTVSPVRNATRSRISCRVGVTLAILSTAATAWVTPAWAIVPGWGMADQARSARHSTVGIASVYNGGRTASGELARPTGLTAASRTLPLGSYAAVTNLRNGRSVVVRINDRGPFIRGRIIDLMPAAAHAIGIDGLGHVAVRERQYRIPRCPTGYHRDRHSVCRIILPHRNREPYGGY